MKSECGVWARVEINSEPNKELRLTPSLASRLRGIVLAAAGAAAARRGKLPSRRETRITGGGAPRAVSEGWIGFWCEWQSANQGAGLDDYEKIDFGDLRGGFCGSGWNESAADCGF